MKQQARFLLGLFATVFALGTALSGWLLVQELYLAGSLAQRGVAVEGEVFDYVYEPPTGTGLRGMGPGKYVPLFRFRANDGQQIVVKANALKDQFPRGTYPVLYLADDPQVARIDSFTTMWLWTAILSACSAVLLLVTSIMARGVGKLR